LIFVSALFLLPIIERFDFAVIFQSCMSLLTLVNIT
jgi:hypothetical protein